MKALKGDGKANAGALGHTVFPPHRDNDGKISRTWVTVVVAKKLESCKF